MAMEALYRLACDEDGCRQVQPVVSSSRELARERAAKVGWDVGPRYKETRSGRLIIHTDYCPQHSKAED